MISLADDSDKKCQYAEAHTCYMITFLVSSPPFSIIGFMMVLTSKFKIYFLFDLTSMSTTYLHNVPNMMAQLLFSIFLTPKMIRAVAISH